MDEEQEWTVHGKNRRLVKPQGVDKRVKFGAKRQAIFLEHLAATCNVTASAAAEALGVAFMLESHLFGSSDERLVRLFEQSVPSPYSYWFACRRSALARRPVKIFHDWLFEAVAAPEARQAA
jgi:DNA-binding transcriptional LysR family regulator